MEHEHTQSYEQHEADIEQSEAYIQAVDALAGKFFDSWREDLLRDDDELGPRVTTTTDAEWIETHGTDQVDVAHAAYEDLPSDWQADGKAAAEAVMNVMFEANGSIDLDNPDMVAIAGQEIHEAWLSRNEIVQGSELDVAFEQLPGDEQKKILKQIEIANRLFSPSDVDIF